ncbi:MAG: ATP-binding protein [Xenococcaceae cyanobacterium MO_167.B52]|nr:ATP-binding protein [Xenococcaceae cyanobacterium MO_167.B52]
MASSEQETNRLIATVALKIRQSLNLSDILQATVDGLRELLRCDRVIVYRFEPDWSGIVTVESVSEDRWSLINSIIKDPCFEESWTLKYRQGEVTAIANVSSGNIDECHQEFLESFDIKANLVAPILLPKSGERVEPEENNQLWGLLIAHHCQEPRQWQKSDFNCIKQIGNQVAIAIQQAELINRNYQELRQRKLAEQQNQQTRQFLQTIIEHLPVAVFVKDAHAENFGKFQLWNPATEKLLGLEAQEALGKTVYDYFPLAQAERFNQQDQEVIRKGNLIEIPQESIYEGQPEHKIIRIIKIPIYNELHQPEHILGIAEDITAYKLAEIELKQAKSELEVKVLQRTEELQNAYNLLQKELTRKEKAQIALQKSEASLKESERRWRSLLENVGLLVMSLDTQGNINYANPFLLKLADYNLSEITGKNWFTDFLPIQGQEEAKAIHNNILQPSFNSSLSHQQTVIFPKSKTEKIIAWNSTQLRNTQGQSTGVICIGEDITEQKAIQKKKDEFVSVVSHELRTPLTAIRGVLSLLAEDKVDPKSQKGKHLLDIGNSSAKHLVKLVNDLLELEYLESGTVELIQQQVNSKELMLRAMDRVQILANKAKIDIQILESDLNFQGDSDRIIQVLTNLLSNAIKFSAPSSNITLSAVKQDQENQSILFAVEDHGRGIPSDKLESIFERFKQVDPSDSKRKGGTGLGLAICRNIVEQHQGTIWVNSVYGEGSTFYFTIPAMINDK